MFSPSHCQASPLAIDGVKGWRELAAECGAKGNGADTGLSHFSFELAGGTKVSVLAVSSKLAVAPRLPKPSSASRANTAATSVIARSYGARAAVNGGYFNLSNGQSTSYVSAAGKVVADPTVNKALIENAKLKPFLPQIFNRSEIRFLVSRKGGKKLTEIANHNDPIPPGYVVDSALQGGPRLLPRLTAEEEAFVRENGGEKVDSIGVNRTAARTAVGLTEDNMLLVVCVAGRGQDEFSSGLTLADLARLMKNLGATAALNLDGGTSSTMVVKEGSDNYVMQIGRKPETLVRSALLIDFKSEL